MNTKRGICLLTLLAGLAALTPTALAQDPVGFNFQGVVSINGILPNETWHEMKAQLLVDGYTYETVYTYVVVIDGKMQVNISWSNVTHDLKNAVVRLIIKRAAGSTPEVVTLPLNSTPHATQASGLTPNAKAMGNVVLQGNQVIEIGSNGSSFTPEGGLDLKSGFKLIFKDMSGQETVMKDCNPNTGECTSWMKYYYNAECTYNADKTCNGNNTYNGTNTYNGNKVCYGTNTYHGNKTCYGNNTYNGTNTYNGNKVCYGTNTYHGNKTCYGNNTYNGTNTYNGNKVCYGTNTYHGNKTCYGNNTYNGTNTYNGNKFCYGTNTYNGDKICNGNNTYNGFCNYTAKSTFTCGADSAIDVNQTGGTASQAAVKITTAADCGLEVTSTAMNPKAAQFNGDVDIVGRVVALEIIAMMKNFRIDHPLDPENRYLYHASIESSELLNLYTGNVVTDEKGFARVELPGWFEALNTDFRYNLTVVGTFAQAMIAEEVSDGSFVIRTDKPAVKVSWQVTGVRKDEWALENPLQVEVDK